MLREWKIFKKALIPGNQNFEFENKWKTTFINSKKARSKSLAKANLLNKKIKGLCLPLMIVILKITGLTFTNSWNLLKKTLNNKMKWKMMLFLRNTVLRMIAIR